MKIEIFMKTRHYRFLGYMDAVSVEHAYFDLEYFITKPKLINDHYTYYDYDGNYLFRISPSSKKLKISDFELIEDEV